MISPASLKRRPHIVKRSSNEPSRRLKRDSEITHLKTELKKKDVVIEEQGSVLRLLLPILCRDLDAAAGSSRDCMPREGETRQFLAGTKTAVETATPEGRPFAVVGRIRQIIERMKETPPISHVDGNRPDPPL